MRFFNATVQIRLITIAALAVFSPFVAAAASAPVFEVIHPTMCQRRMTVKTSDTIQERIRQKIFRERPFALVVGSVTDKALGKVGLAEIGLSESLVRVKLVPRALNRVSPFAVRLRTRASGVQEVESGLYFPDAHPTVWRRVENLILEEQLMEDPFVGESSRVQREMSVGFVGDLDGDRARSFVDIDWLGRLRLGLEFPCEKLSEYVTDGGISVTVGVSSPLAVDSARFCRVIIAYAP